MYRGKCKEFSKNLVNQNSTLQLVRGYYICPYWCQQEHWWCKDPLGNIIDPTKLQFPSKGLGKYIEYNGVCYCTNCKKEMLEEEEAYDYGTCSLKCLKNLVGV